MASGSCVPHQQAEHMTAPTRPRTTSMKTLANGEPSTHDPAQTSVLIDHSMNASHHGGLATSMLVSTDIPGEIQRSASSGSSNVTLTGTR
jgi:hypothetical protein